MRRRIPGAIVSLSLAASSTIGGEWTAPPVAISRKTYEIAYPKKTMSSAALELERLAAVLGIAATPPAPKVVETVEGEERERSVDPKDDREPRGSSTSSRRSVPAASTPTAGAAASRSPWNAGFRPRIGRAWSSR